MPELRLPMPYWADGKAVPEVGGTAKNDLYKPYGHWIWQKNLSLDMISRGCNANRAWPGWARWISLKANGELGTYRNGNDLMERMHQAVSAAHWAHHIWYIPGIVFWGCDMCSCWCWHSPCVLLRLRHPQKVGCVPCRHKRRAAVRTRTIIQTTGLDEVRKTYRKQLKSALCAANDALLLKDPDSGSATGP